MDANILENKHVKLVRPIVLGCKYPAYITESFVTREDADASEAYGTTMLRTSAVTAIEKWNNSIPVVE